MKKSLDRSKLVCVGMRENSKFEIPFVPEHVCFFCLRSLFAFREIRRRNLRNEKLPSKRVVFSVLFFFFLFKGNFTTSQRRRPASFSRQLVSFRGICGKFLKRKYATFDLARTNGSVPSISLLLKLSMTLFDFFFQIFNGISITKLIILDRTFEYKL